MQLRQKLKFTFHLGFSTLARVFLARLDARRLSKLIMMDMYAAPKHAAEPARRPGRARQMRVRRAPLASLVVITALASAAAEPRGNHFLAFTKFSTFEKSRGLTTGEHIFTSPELAAPLDWDQLIVSWNAQMPKAGYLRVEARAIYPHGPTKYYTLGLWSGDPAGYPRESVRHQQDADGDVSTDTLILKKPAQRLQLRLTLGGGQRPKLKFLGLCLTDTRAASVALPPNRTAWGKTIDVPERSQMAYPDGQVLCSPATVSMLLAYWGQKLHRSELNRDVPEIAQEVYDPNWEGTGNWPFNMAYAGSFPGLRAYVTRLSDVSELEDWIAAGIPVGVSVCYNKLRGKEGPPSPSLRVISSVLRKSLVT